MRPAATAATYSGSTRQDFRRQIKRRSPRASGGEETWLTSLVEYETRLDFSGTYHSPSVFEFPGYLLR